MDKKQKKRLKRLAKKKKDKATAQATQDKVKKQMGMFDRLPKVCSSCGKDFPKTREAHMSWRVVVRSEEQQVRLFCPECQDKVKELIGDQQ
jgi:predicted RNA-binding Zn-ribbon protein involved in translation (DUF1610 family)|tara:strand:- start:1283 stop:1555 length:273 start_codon:yes stop_codon:yes gene_type:complete